MVHSHEEQGQNPQAHKKRQQEASFSLAVVFELSGECGVTEILILPVRNELGKSAALDTVQVAGLGAAKRLVGLGMARSKRCRERPPSPDQARKQKKRAYQPHDGHEAKCFVGIHRA